MSEGYLSYAAARSTQAEQLEVWAQGKGWFADLFVDLPITSETYIYVFLPLLVFEAGLATDVRAMVRDAAPILLLAVIATIVTTAVIGLALWPVSGRSLVVCLMLGAVVVFLPIIIAYTSWVYRVMRGRVTLEHVAHSGDHY